MAKKKAKGPKSIAGVKVPRRMRRPLRQASDLLQHPMVADLAAAALISAAAAIRNNKKVRSAARTATDKAGDAAQGIGSGAASLATVIAARAKQGAQAVGEAYEGLGASSGNGSSGSASGRGKAKSGKKPKKKSAS